MGYKKFLRIAVDIFTGFSCERFLGISADSQERYIKIVLKLKRKYEHYGAFFSKYPFLSQSLFLRKCNKKVIVTQVYFFNSHLKIILKL